MCLNGMLKSLRVIYNDAFAESANGASVFDLHDLPSMVAVEARAFRGSSAAVLRLHGSFPALEEIGHLASSDFYLCPILHAAAMCPPLLCAYS